MEKLENLIKLIPLGSIFLILCGSIKLVVYYKLFNVSIVEYISIQEYLTLFIDDILYYVLIFGAGLILYFLDYFRYNGEDFGHKQLEPEKYKKDRLISLIFFFITLLLTIFLSYNSDCKSKSVEIIGIGIYWMLFFLHIYSSSTKINFPYPTFIMTAVVVYSIMNGYKEGYQIMENKDKIKYSIHFKTKKYTTSKKLKYLGKTEHFIFLYDLKSKRTTILKIDDLVKINVN